MSELDLDLEAAIDRVGRAEVFALARAAGWGSATTPPKWVWWQIVQEVSRRNAAATPEMGVAETPSGEEK